MTEMTAEPAVSRLWYAICDTFAERYGCPLPIAVLELGNRKKGWHVTLNASTEPADGLPPFFALCLWYGFPAGIIGPNQGLIAAGELANEKTFLAALPSLPPIP